MNNSSLLVAVNAGSTAEVPLGAMQSASGVSTVGGGSVPNRLLLPTTYLNRLGFTTVNPVTYKLYITNKGGLLTGLLLTEAAIIDKTGAIRYDWSGIAMKKAGSNAGVSFGLPDRLDGLNGVWSLRATDFPDINTLGKFGYRVAYQGTYDNTYLRLDGLYPMNGNLNMGNYSIKNATDISYTGWLYGNNAVMNNLLTGTITNAGNITTQSINGKTTLLGSANAANYANNVNGNYSYANFDLLYANCINCGFAGDTNTGISTKFNAAAGDVRIGANGNKGTLFVKDVILGQASGETLSPMSNAALSDRLSRYVDRGIIVVKDYGPSQPPYQLNKPDIINTSDPAFANHPGGYACRWTGQGTAPVAKVELIPALQWTQAAVLGTMQLDFNGSYIDASNQLHLAGNIYQDQYALGALQTYAVENGNNWLIYSRTPNYDGSSAYSGGTVLAHVYCDYGSH